MNEQIIGTDFHVEPGLEVSHGTLRHAVQQSVTDSNQSVFWMEGDVTQSVLAFE